jgi:hypothetical protein
VPRELATDQRFLRDVVNILEHPDVELRVPLRWVIGSSDRSWYHAGLEEKDGGNQRPMRYKREECGEILRERAVSLDVAST